MIYYAESLNHKVYIHDGKKVYESRKRLYELEEEPETNYFFRASKWMILNIGKIQSVRPLLDGRFEATLDNDEKVHISRKYVSQLKKMLDL